MKLSDSIPVLWELFLVGVWLLVAVLIVAAP